MESRMIKTSDESRQLQALQRRAPRKQSTPHRAPSSGDITPGRIFTIDFGMTGSKDPKESRRGSWPFASGSWSTAESAGIITQHRRFSNPETHPISDRTPDLGVQDLAIQPLSALSIQDRPGSEKKPSLPSVPVESLADQYLDTMVMDDVWRAACINKIRQNKRKLAPKPVFKKSSKRNQRAATAAKSVDHLHNVSMKTYKSRSRYATHAPTPPVSPRAAYRSEDSSSPSSDSGFISSSPTPAPSPSRPLRMRSTRSWPMNNSSASNLIDIPASMVGRSCLSCGCTNTTCWRRTLGGIICNSCGLRYKKCGIVCADIKCRYIPTRSEIREMKSQGMHEARCYSCQGRVSVRGEGAERRV